MAYTQKTLPTDASVADFVAAIADERRRDEAARIVPILERASGETPRIWGVSMVGFGEYHYKHPGGQQGFWFLTGFAPRKAAMTIYVMPGFEQWPDLMRRLGRFTTSQSCLYLKRLTDVDEAVLEELVRRSVDVMRERHAVR
ncbi:DUF1801 domain-containing protein [Aquibium sp. LZ166]|uniref:DUF1801 domain-containing protein n=1 Tax=Aquibium pacificus TaxID=3153579 RepID=A0ABV3SQF3_9HYPH